MEYKRILKKKRAERHDWPKRSPYDAFFLLDYLRSAMFRTVVVIRGNIAEHSWSYNIFLVSF